MSGYRNEPEALAWLGSGQATATDLQQIAAEFPGLRPAVAAHPLAYPALLEWLSSLRDPAVDAALSGRVPRTGPVAPPPSNQTFPQPQPTQQLTQQPTQPLPVMQQSPQQPTQPLQQPTQAAPPWQPPGQPGGPSPAFNAGYPSGYPGAYPAPGYGAANAPGQPPKKRGAALIVAIVVAALLLGGGVYLVWSMAKPGKVTADTPPSVSASASAPSASQAAASEEPSPSSESPTAAPEPTEAEAAFTCWDESLVDSVEQCPNPSGADDYYRFLNYAFPSTLDHDSCVERDSSDKSDYTGVTVMWDCELGHSLLRYRLWEQASDAERHYQRKFGGDKTRAAYDVELVGYDQPLAGWGKEAKARQNDEVTGTKRYAFTIWLPEYQLSISAEGDTRDDLREALALVRMRSPEELFAHASDTEPGEYALRLLAE